MKYIFVSLFIHLALALFLLHTKTYEASGGKEGESPSSSPEIAHFINNQMPTEQTKIKTKIKTLEIKNTINLLDKKAIEKERLEKEKKLEEEKRAKLEKAIQEKTAKEKEAREIAKQKAKLKAESEKKKIANNKESNNANNPNSKGRGNAIGDTKGNGKGIDGDGLGSSKKRTDEQIAQAIAAIQTRIMDYWHPPEEFAARSDISIEIELFLDDKGNILSYKLLNQQDTPAYKAVAASVIRVLNDPNVVPLPVSKNKKFNNIILKFCPRDVL